MATRGIKEMVRFTLQQGWLPIKLKIVKKYCHDDDPKGVKVWGMYKQFELNNILQ